MGGDTLMDNFTDYADNTTPASDNLAKLSPIADNLATLSSEPEIPHYEKIYKIELYLYGEELQNFDIEAKAWGWKYFIFEGEKA